MSFQRFWIDLTLKIKQNRWPFVIFFLFYLFGAVYYGIHEQNASLGQILLIALCVHQPTITNDLSALYQLLFPIFLEVVVFGFLIGALLERYNPVVTSKIIAAHQSNHTIVLGYHHLGERIVEYLQEKKKPYSLIEMDKSKVLDLIDNGEPVVVGDFTEKATLLDAGADKCKEVFFVTNDFRKALISISKIREINKKCNLYLRVFEEELQDYLEQEPWNAFTFSTSQWSLEYIKKWTKSKIGTSVVLGFNHISQLISNHIAHELNREVILIDPKIDEEIYIDDPKIKIFQNSYTTTKGLKDICDLKQVSQLFICWKSETHFSEAILLVMEISKEFPEIEIYVRIFDEETIPIFAQYNIKTFSTSSKAFELLQKAVKSNSALRNP
ncbi:NAD-binding protein [Candidatus Harpocratesius sp.]